MLKKISLFAMLAIAFCQTSDAQVQTKKLILDRTSIDHRKTEQENFARALSMAEEKGWATSFITRNGNIAFLVGVDPFGYPLYFTTENNVVAAATTQANVLWPGGSSGLNLSGSSPAVKDKMAVWDGGKVLDQHVELSGRVIQKDDNVPPISDHATHVAGTMIASGINPIAKGMAYGSQRLVAYDFNNDISEMFDEAEDILLSNHSYGTLAGWRYNGGQSRWEFYGRENENEDYKFGYYDSRAQLLDSIAYNAPYYLIVKSSGNNRNENGPAVGQNYWRLNGSGQMVNAGSRPPGISSNDGYDIISTYGTAKNILTVGAVRGIEFGYTKSDDVIMSSFSSWGPTDDGRIKPDVVADGVDVLSPIAGSTTSYASFSGTSMSSPNATGSLLLLQEYYSQLHGGSFMWSSTLKGLAIHTADESGYGDGPDYQHGWGLLNVGKAAKVIQSNNTGSHLIEENVLNDGSTYSLDVVASGNGPLVATIVWTDVKGTVDFSDVLDNTNKKLVNDLDIRISKGATVYQPWILNPSSPTDIASKGDNVLDNVERINIDNAIPGQTYTITINHKGSLERGSQAFSLIVSGVGGQAYCTSSASSDAGSRIDSVGFGTIENVNPTGCTTYSDFTSLSTSVKPGDVVPFGIKVNSCNATNNSKIVKLFIDYNNNGSFDDAGELAATSNSLSNGDIFTGSITIPPTIISGNSSLLRVVLNEASSANDVVACGNYGNGETQDYRIQFTPATNDLSMIGLVSPVSGVCANSSQYVTVRVRNVGVTDKSGIPLTAVIKQGSTLVATLSGMNPSIISPSSVSTYTFPLPFVSMGGAQYSIDIFHSDATDQNRTNDTLKTLVTIAETPVEPEASAVVCGSNALLKVNNPATNNYFWYTSATSQEPVAFGSNTATTDIPGDNTFYVGSGAQGTVGLESKSDFPGGGGYLANTANFIKYSASVPVILESAKMYIKYPGKVEFIVANITSHTTGGFNYQAISTNTIDVYATSPNPAPGTQDVYDADDNGAVFNLNIYLPAGDHAIIVRPLGSTNIFRNNNVTGNPYPFEIPNVISFTGNSALLAANPDYYQSFYYYLYNMKVRTNECVSTRAAVVATVAPTPVITQVGDSLESSIDNGNQWYVNGVNIPGATGKRHKPMTGGNYTVKVTDNVGCQRISAEFLVTFTAIDPVDNALAGLSVNPNPSNGNFTLRFKAIKKADLHIELMNIQGQQVYNKTYPGFIGQLSEYLQLRNLSSGLYVLKVVHDGKTYYDKVLIGK